MGLLSSKDESLSNVRGAKISSKVVTVTPDIAKKWLESMVENQRSPSERAILKYSRAMAQGNWKTAAPLSFNQEGRLIDGQHRLLAVIKANRPIEFVVLQGLESDSIAAIDMGVVRTSAHLAKLQGLAVTAKHLSLLNCCLFNPVGSATARPPSYSKQEQVEMARIHFDALDFALRKKSNALSIEYAPYVAPVARAYYSENHLRLEQFLQVLHSGYAISENPNDDTAAIALRNLHFKNRQTSMRVSGGTECRIQAFKIACNALANFILRKPVKVLKESSYNQFPVAAFDEWWQSKLKDAA